MEEKLFELLQVSLGTRNKLSRVFNSEEWIALLNESKRQAISGVMQDGLERLPSEQRPEKKVLFKWIGLAQVTEATNELHQKRARELTNRFLAAGFHSCVLKGVGMAILYPHPLRRKCGDIDLWVSGRRKDVMKWLRTKYKIGEVRWHHADVQIFDDVQTEIHFHATWLFNPIHNRRLQRYFDNEKQELLKERNNESHELGYNYPTGEFNAVYSLVHSFHHLLECGIGFRHVVDYFYIVSNLTVKERERAVEVIMQTGLYQFLGAMMFVLKEACGMASEKLLCPPDDVEGEFLLSEIEAAGNFGYERVGEDLPTNSFLRLRTMAKHYPSEMLWMMPWKIWHWLWRLGHRKWS